MPQPYVSRPEAEAFLAALADAIENLDEALELLQRAFTLDPKYRTMAKTDTDFDPIRTNDRFQALLEGE